VSRTVDGHAGHKVPRVSGGWRVSPLFRTKLVRLLQTTTTLGATYFRDLLISPRRSAEIDA